MRNTLLFLTLFVFSADVFAAPALEYDGLTSVTACGTNDALFNETNIYTMCGWIYPRTIGEGSAGRIFDRGSNATLGIAFSLIGTATLQFLATGSSDMTRQSSNGAVTLNAWNYVCATTTNSIDAGAVHMFQFNERLVGGETTYKTTTNGSGIEDNNGVAFRIGNNSAGSRTFLGSIRNGQVWNRVLSVPEMKESGAMAGSVPFGLIAWWELDTTGPKAKNLAAGSNVSDCTTFTAVTESTSMPKIAFRSGYQ